MLLEPIQCPKCGSILEVQRTDKAATCAYCGSRFRVTRSMSGNLMGVLGEIKSDTGIMAKREAVEYLMDRLDNLEQERTRLEWKIQYESGIPTPKHRATAQELQSLLDQAQRRAQEKYSPEMARLDGEIKSTIERIAELGAEIDRLAMEDL